MQQFHIIIFLHFKCQFEGLELVVLAYMKSLSRVLGRQGPMVIKHGASLNEHVCEDLDTNNLTELCWFQLVTATPAGLLEMCVARRETSAPVNQATQEPNATSVPQDTMDSHHAEVSRHAWGGSVIWQMSQECPPFAPCCLFCVEGVGVGGGVVVVRGV